ncbi:GNAT family N-acetyltransferase [Streptomyces sp. NPDC056716]|uniref:GNAT family N-acetyltransferase n=1 Tax=unclassified Streptomyces TaxID=2593676 RepID=UPI00369277E1
MNSPEWAGAIHGRGLRALARVLGSTSVGGATFDAPGVSACIVPAAIDEKGVNFVAHTARDALVPRLPHIAGMYQAVGIQQWSVYVPESEHTVAKSLEAMGYRSQKRARAILLDLSAFDPRPVGDLDYLSNTDLSMFGRISAAAYDRPALARAFGQKPDTPHLRVYQARLDGAPVCALLTIDVASDRGLDCAAYFLGTVPSARGRGIAPRLFTAALLEARSRGCATCSCQASAMGAPLWARMGFETVFYFNCFAPEKGAQALTGAADLAACSIFAQ